MPSVSGCLVTVPLPKFPVYTLPIGDDDCDGFATTDEIAIGADPAAPCADAPGADDETDDRWPPDFDDNRVINTTDVFNVLPP
jgi:hypothetical protein